MCTKDLILFVCQCRLLLCVHVCKQSVGNTVLFYKTLYRLRGLSFRSEICYNVSGSWWVNCVGGTAGPEDSGPLTAHVSPD